MSRAPVAGLALDDIEAVVLDLDGVLTDTASLHERAWTETFAPVLEEAGVRPFDHGDYGRLVDGEPRLDGVEHVLADRGVALPVGRPTDPPGTASRWAVANEKDRRYVELVHSEGPRPFPSSATFLTRLRASGIEVAVVSASRHCAEILDQAGLADLVDVRVDGVSASVMGLAGKPDPATFLEAVRRLGVEVDRAVVVEDALAGVAAGRAGGFSEVVAVNRREVPRRAYEEAGATMVVTDLADLELDGRGPASDGWHLVLGGGAGIEETYESLTTLANGYMGVRGAPADARDDGRHYPGTYLAGVYNRLVSRVGTDTVEEEAMVNVPNFLPLTFSVAGGPWLGEESSRRFAERTTLDLRRGVLRRRFRVEDPEGRQTAVVERRLVSMAEPHLAAIEQVLVPLNWSGELSVRSALDGTVGTTETVEERLLSHRHLVPAGAGHYDDEVLWLTAGTSQSNVRIAEAARTRVEVPGGSARPGRARRRTAKGPTGGAGSVEREWRIEVAAGGRVRVEKVAAVYTTHDRAISEPQLAAREALEEGASFDEVLVRHAAAWARIWRRAGVELEVEADGSFVRAALDPVTTVRLHQFHVLQVASPHVVELDVGLGARGLHGEGYLGHVFWDTLFVFPLLNLRFPRTARALLSYRHRRLAMARQLARRSGHRGAMFPWQSGSDGRDETPTTLFNPRSGHWIPDHSGRQRHAGLAVAFEHWQHWQSSRDEEFFFTVGTELVLEIARFFADLAEWDEADGRYHIRGVMGPDEFHDGYPERPGEGVDDNAYTNVMTAWLLERAVELAERSLSVPNDGVLEVLGIGTEELERFDHVSRRLHVPFHDGLISQFAGYEDLALLDLATYRERYGDIGRLDLILEAEGDSVNRYQVGKQPDALMLFFLMSAEELRSTFGRLGYELDAEVIRRTVDFYSGRVVHGSSLSRVVHAWVSSRRDRAASWHHFVDALARDVTDNAGGTTREGIHLGAMAGTVDLVQRCYTGLEVRDDAVWLNPVLPAPLRRLRFSIGYRHQELEIDVDQRRLRVTARPGTAEAVRVVLIDEVVELEPGQSVERLVPGAAAVSAPDRPAEGSRQRR